jgi:hypothetical protein
MTPKPGKLVALKATGVWGNEPYADTAREVRDAGADVGVRADAKSPGKDRKIPGRRKGIVTFQCG